MATQTTYVDPLPWSAVNTMGQPLYPEGYSREPLRFASKEECLATIKARGKEASYWPAHCPRRYRSSREAVAEIVTNAWKAA